MAARARKRIRVDRAQDRVAVRRSATANAAQVATAAPAEHPLAGLQRQVGNQAVARLVGTGSIQRFAFKNTDWERTTNVTRSTDGGVGVAFFKDGSPNPLVVKASDDPPRETLFATLLHKKLGKKRGISTPPTRVADTGERAQIAQQVADKTTDWKAEREKELTVQQYATGGAPHVWVMGMAKGKTFGSGRERTKGFTKAPLGMPRIVELLESPDYASRMGFVTHCDLFLGNGDRMDMGNLGNWMTDEAGAIELIDNFEKMSTQGLTQQAQEMWEMMYKEELKPSQFQQKGESTYHVIKMSLSEDLRASMDKSLRMSGEERKKQFGKHFAKGMAKARKMILAKLAPKFGRRSRGMKAIVTAGEGGQEAWNVVKERVRIVKSLK